MLNLTHEDRRILEDLRLARQAARKVFLSLLRKVVWSPLNKGFKDMIRANLDNYWAEQVFCEKALIDNFTPTNFSKARIKLLNHLYGGNPVDEAILKGTLEDIKFAAIPKGVAH